MSRRPHVEQPFLGKRDPETGRALCCWCGKVVPPRSVRWCGDDCVQTYLIAKGDQNAARRACWARDWGVCQLCGTDTVAPHEVTDYCGKPIPRARMNHQAGAWDADHIVPIAEGGALARENLRTLCRPCHARVTRELRARLAAKRKAAKASGGSS